MFTFDLASTYTASDLLFTTQEKVIAQLGGFASSEKIEELISQVSGELDAGLGYPAANAGGHSIAECDYTLTMWVRENYSSLNMFRRFLIEKPVVSVNDTTIDPESIVADLDKGDVRLVCGSAVTRWPVGKLVFTFTAGFVMPSAPDKPVLPSRMLPPQLERAAIDLIAFRHTLSTGKPCGQVLKQMNLPGAGMLSFDVQTPKLGRDSLPGHVASILAPWRFSRDGMA